MEARRRTFKTLSYMAVLFAAALVFAVTATKAYAAEAFLDNNTTQLENGYTYYVTGEKTVSSNLAVQEGGNVTLHCLKGGILWAVHGISVPKGSKLTIEGSGRVYAYGDEYYPGIGGGGGQDGGTIIINGEDLRVEAKGGDNAAGIGGGRGENSATIRIESGTVYAYGKAGGAGIGSAAHGNFKGDVTITGGTVYAYSEIYDDEIHHGGAGIGSGAYGHYEGTINISGGTVTAEGKGGGAGLCAGRHGNASDGTVNISGGMVTATGDNGGAGIGGGKEQEALLFTFGGEGSNVTITGGTVVANSTYCAIGHGYKDDVVGNLTLEKNMMVRVGDTGGSLKDASPAASRVSDVQENKCARIEVCQHPENYYGIDEVGHVRTCSYCATEFTKENHELKEVEGTAITRTCTQEGRSADQKCTACGYTVFGQSTGFAEHNWTLTRYGWMDDYSMVTANRACKRDECGYVEQESARTTAEVTEATCETPEMTTYTAVFENEAFGTQVRILHTGEPLGHDWGEWTTAKEPTVSEAGLETRTCNRDASHTEDRVIPPLDHEHSLTLVPAVEASCEKRGSKAYYECAGCGAWYADAEGTQQVSGSDILIHAKGHKAGEPVQGEVTEPTCDFIGGYNVYTYCETCGKQIGFERVVIPADPDAHDWGEWEVAKEATVDAEGLEVRYCKNDSSHKETRLIPKLDSIEGAEVVLSASAFTYTGKVQKPEIKTIGGKALSSGTDYQIAWSDKSSKNVGTYTVTITGTGAYAGTTEATYKIDKAANPLAIKAKTATVKYSKLKKKAQTLAVTKVIKFTEKGQGAMTYTKASGNKKIAINKTTGKVTIKKGLKKGVYKVKVKVKAAGNANYAPSAEKTVTFKVKVK